MKPLAGLLLSLALLASAGAQIHADFQISKGGAPLGSFRARLDHDKAPRTCANFIGLATGERPWVDPATSRIVLDTPFYNGRIFHRLIHSFVIQGGSSDGVGSRGSGYLIQDEFHADLRHSGRYMLSMAKAGEPGTGNSQFFITLEAATFLDDKHSVFGEVIEGRELIDAFADPLLNPTDRSAAGAAPNASGYSDRPVTELRIDSVTLSGPSLAGFDIHDPALELPTFASVRPRPSRNASLANFATTFDRRARCDYLYAYSTNLVTSTPFRHILSIEASPDYTYTVTGATFPRFFATIAEIDYSFLQNPSPASIPAGSSLVFTTRTGVSLTVVPDGTGGGTWSDSLGNSGTLVAFGVSDLAPATGAYSSTPIVGTQAQFLPLLGLDFQLDAPGGPSNRSTYSLTLDFRDADAGWSDGSAWTLAAGLDSVSFLNAFHVNP